MLRFNPDSYKAAGGVIEGCFKLTKVGVLSVRKKEWKKLSKG